MTYKTKIIVKYLFILFITTLFSLAGCSTTTVSSKNETERTETKNRAYEVDHIKTLNFNEVEVKAEHGDVLSQYQLGVIYFEGLGDTLDYKEAVKWYTRAAEQGNAEAQFALGSMYENGRGVKTNPVTAVQWYQKAEKEGHPEASLAIGKLFDRPKMQEKSDSEKAVEYYQKTAERGNMDAQYLLGKLYYNDGEVENAAKWLRKAASQGHPIAPLLLADIIMQYGKNVQDPREVAKWLRKIVRKGAKESMYYEAKFFADTLCRLYFTACF